VCGVSRRGGWVLLLGVTGLTGAASAAPPVRSSELDLGTYVHTFGTLELGRGIRFNNPYRLDTVLGDSPESLSLTATYLDLGLGAALGPADGLQHGAMLHFAIALDGIPQEVLTPSYVAVSRLHEEFLLYGRAGIPIVLEPDWSAGGELALGGAWLVTAGLGVGSELVGSLFYGAATSERPVTVIPVVSLQVGLFADYEILP
jgi:hypothetical protein